MKKNLVKAIVLGALGVMCIIRGLMGFQYDKHDYTEYGLYAGAAYKVNTEMIRQANDKALQMVAVGALVLIASSSPWKEYRREKRERDELYNSEE